MCVYVCICVCTMCVGTVMSVCGHVGVARAVRLYVYMYMENVSTCVRNVNDQICNCWWETILTTSPCEIYRRTS